MWSGSQDNTLRSIYETRTRCSPANRCSPPPSQIRSASPSWNRIQASCMGIRPLRVRPHKGTCRAQAGLLTPGTVRSRQDGRGRWLPTAAAYRGAMRGRVHWRPRRLARLIVAVLSDLLSGRLPVQRHQPNRSSSGDRRDDTPQGSICHWGEIDTRAIRREQLSGLRRAECWGLTRVGPRVSHYGQGHTDDEGRGMAIERRASASAPSTTTASGRWRGTTCCCTPAAPG